MVHQSFCYCFYYFFGLFYHGKSVFGSQDHCQTQVGWSSRYFRGVSTVSLHRGSQSNFVCCVSTVVCVRTNPNGQLPQERLSYEEVRSLTSVQQDRTLQVLPAMRVQQRQTWYQKFRQIFPSHFPPLGASFHTQLTLFSVNPFLYRNTVHKMEVSTSEILSVVTLKWVLLYQSTSWRFLLLSMVSLFLLGLRKENHVRQITYSLSLVRR